jgi:hypothetical protein
LAVSDKFGGFGRALLHAPVSQVAVRV